MDLPGDDIAMDYSRSSLNFVIVPALRLTLNLAFESLRTLPLVGTHAAVEKQSRPRHRSTKVTGYALNHRSSHHPLADEIESLRVVRVQGETALSGIRKNCLIH